MRCRRRICELVVVGVVAVLARVVVGGDGGGGGGSSSKRARRLVGAELANGADEHVGGTRLLSGRASACDLHAPAANSEEGRD